MASTITTPQATSAVHRSPTGSATPPGLQRLPALLVALITLLQGAAWLGWLPVSSGSAGKTAFATVEMALIFLLVWNGWRIRRHILLQPHPVTEASRHLRRVATLTFGSLLICSLGDAVNRNYSQTFYAHDSVIEHSYLVDSVWFFFPGYALFVAAAWFATRDLVPLWLRLSSLLVAALAGLASFADLVLPGTSSYVMAITGSYTALISLMVPAALWIALAFGRPAWHVAAGALLATIADALIGHFWLFGEGHYPGIAYLNMVVYFLSQALIQQLPLVLSSQQPARS